MSSLQNRHILVGVSAGIAAYKSPELVRRLRDRGADVQVIMSRNAEQFITALTLQAVSGHPVHSYEMDAESESGMGHIDLARWADAVIVAPATANLLARITQGMADELLTTVCLAADCPIALAPAMNQKMWRDEATTANIELLTSRGIRVLGPGSGDQACGDTGPGRMLEPLELATEMESLFTHTALSGVGVLLTAGPTWEALDPVRGLTNHSSGHMGYSLARAAVESGARVTLVSGPTRLDPPENLEFVPVESASDMHTAVFDRVSAADLFIGVAAVADYRPVEVSHTKIKKSADNTTIELVKNPDILADVAALDEGPFTVGFAAETEDLESHARKKLERKGLDLIVANLVGSALAGFGDLPHSAILISRDSQTDFPQTSKDKLARSLVAEIARIYGDSNPPDRTNNVTPITKCPDKASR